MLGIGVALYAPFAPLPVRITQEKIDAAVAHSLREAVLPSPAAKVYEAILPSVVRVNAYVTDPKTKEEVQYGVGTGVYRGQRQLSPDQPARVQGAERSRSHLAWMGSRARFFNGARPEHDLAVIRAQKNPDDMVAATMASTQNLAPGDHVCGGFPFGIGPSVRLASCRAWGETSCHRRAGGCCPT